MKKTLLEKRLLNLLSMVNNAKEKRVLVYANKQLNKLINELTN